MAVRLALPGTAITDANATLGKDTIQITAIGTLTLTSMLPLVNEDTDIAGPGQANFIVDGDATYQTLDFGSNGATYTVSDMTFTNGFNATGGGALSVRGTTTLTRVAISRNKANSGGGGIVTHNGSHLTLVASTSDGPGDSD